MKNPPLAQLLCADGIGPVAYLTHNVPAARGAFRSAGVARPQVLGGNVDIVRVLAMRAEIETGRYVSDADEVAERVLATIAHSWRH
jgi:hypothetical protein